MWGTLCGKGGWLMTVRERTEEIERITLSPFATLSENSRGRAVPENHARYGPAFSGTGTASSIARHSAG